MATEIHEQHIVRHDNDGMINEEPATNVAARIIYTLFGILIALLSLRVILSLLGANRNNGFADAIYSVTQPFVSPFAGLFNVDETFGRVRFEFETMFAILIYALLSWVIVRILTLGSRTRVVD